VSMKLFIRMGLHSLACGIALALLGACQADKMAPGNQPQITVKGKIVTEDGAPAKDCKLEFYDTATVKPNYSWDVSTNFSQQIQTAKLAEDFYFRTRCKGERVPARSRIYSENDLSNSDFIIDLGQMIVGDGMIAVTGRVTTVGGLKPAACSLGLYTGFHAKPSVSWDVGSEVSVEFEREKVDGHFQFRLDCGGFFILYKSPRRPESWLDDVGGKIELGEMLVRER